MDYKALIETCENHVRDGQGHRVELTFRELRLSEIPREFRLPMANLCRRVGLLMTGLKLLSPVVSTGIPSERPTPRELAEYSVLLERCGAVREALTTLQEVDTEVAPEALLYRAFCYFKFWEYAEAVPALLEYIERAKTPYSRLVGQVNLAAAYIVAGPEEKAAAIVTENIAYAGEHGFNRLRGNCFELQAQIAFQRHDFAAVRKNLAQAEKIFAEEKTFDQLFVRKWLTVLSAFETRDPAGLVFLREEATRRQDWETVREADLFRLRVRFEPSAFAHLYFGTPFKAYRARIEQQLGHKPLVSEYQFGGSGKRVFDIRTGESSDARINAGKHLHVLLTVFLRDLYRPLRVGSIFAEVYKDERFDVYSSPLRVHQLLFRLRRWLADNNVPVIIAEENGTYRLQLCGDFTFKLHLEAAPEESKWMPYWHRLEPHLTDNLSPAEIRERLDLKLSTSKRFLSWALESGRLERFGSSNLSRYRKVS